MARAFSAWIEPKAVDDVDVNNITDTNKGLALYLGQRQSGGSSSTAKPSLAKGRVVSGYEFLGGDPNDKKNWRATGTAPR